MFEIREKTGEPAVTLQHGLNVFHEALEGGEVRYLVTGCDAGDYEIIYKKNFDYVRSIIPEGFRDIEAFSDFRSYDESDKDYLIMDQFAMRKKVVFLEVNEYSIAIGRVLLRDCEEMDVYYTDPKIYWFFPASERLHVGEDLPKDTDEVLFVTQPLGYSYQNSTGNKLGILAVFQSMFIFQTLSDKSLSRIRYFHLNFTSDRVGIGAIMVHTSRLEHIFKLVGWKVVISGDMLGKYPRIMLEKYLNLPEYPMDATQDNTLEDDEMLVPRLFVTYIGMHADRSIDRNWFRDDFIAQMDEYAKAVIGGRKILGVFIRGTDYITTNLPGLMKNASCDEMLPKIHEWMDNYGFDGIFLATEDVGILRKMKDEFGDLVRIVAQERFSQEEFKTVKLIAELENEKYEGIEKEEHIEDMTVNYFYAMYVLASCNSFISSGLSNGVDIVKCFNQGKFEQYYQFAPGTDKPGEKT